MKRLTNKTRGLILAGALALSVLALAACGGGDSTNAAPQHRKSRHRFGFGQLTELDVGRSFLRAVTSGRQRFRCHSRIGNLGEWPR